MASKYCSSLDSTTVGGKIVVCDADPWTDATFVVKNAGSIAMILVYYQTSAYNTFALPEVLPASIVSYTEGDTIKNYVAQSWDLRASIQLLGTRVGIPPPAPMVAYFSARGPSIMATDLLKPDIHGPGVDILAAWPSQVGPVVASSYFKIIAGTSMPTPHLTGVAALIKSAHPTWSPAAIRIAMMTTASIMDNTGELITDEN